MEKTHIGVLVGSLRRDSFSKSVARTLMSQMPDRFDMELIEIGDLALYNQDLDTEASIPEPWTRFRDAARAKDGFLFVTPEYNRSVPAALKNALDIGSRPPARSVWNAKPAALVSVSPGKLGGFGASNHFRQSMTSLNLYLMAQPEAYLGGILASMDKQGNVTDEKTLAFLQKIADAFADWVDIFIKK